MKILFPLRKTSHAPYSMKNKKQTCLLKKFLSTRLDNKLLCLEGLGYKIQTEGRRQEKKKT